LKISLNFLLVFFYFLQNCFLKIHVFFLLVSSLVLTDLSRGKGQIEADRDSNQIHQTYL